MKYKATIRTTLEPNEWETIGVYDRPDQAHQVLRDHLTMRWPKWNPPNVLGGKTYTVPLDYGITGAGKVESIYETEQEREIVDRIKALKDAKATLERELALLYDQYPDLYNEAR